MEGKTNERLEKHQMSVEHSPHGRGHAYIRVSDAGMDADDKDVLRAMRLLFRTYADPTSQGWAQGLRVVLASFANRDAGEVFHAIVAVVDALRCARKSGFRFTNPDCANCAQYLCGDERLLMGCLIACREGRRSVSHANALLMCEGNDTGAFLARLGDLARLMAMPPKTSAHVSAPKIAAAKKTMTWRLS